MATSESMSQLVHALLPRLLAGADQLHEALAAQWNAASFTLQTETNWGFYAYFSVPAGLPLAEPRQLVGGDAIIPVKGVSHNAGCVLYVKDGVLDFLEVYTYDEPWEHPPDFGMPNHVQAISATDTWPTGASTRGA